LCGTAAIAPYTRAECSSARQQLGLVVIDACVHAPARECSGMTRANNPKCVESVLH